MVKVKITQEQADAVERFKTEQYKSLKKEKEYPSSRFVEWALPLFELDADDIHDALYIGYEVEPEFKAGDWVVYKSNIHKMPIVRKVVEINQHISGVTLDRELIIAPLNELRHATESEISEEKERRFFAKHGRKPWELKGKDLIADTMDGLLEIIKETDSRNGYWAYSFFGHNNYVIGKAELLVGGLTGRFEVACFSENRLDRKDVDNE